jgi:hypothetical protein
MKKRRLLQNLTLTHLVGVGGFYIPYGIFALFFEGEKKCVLEFCP